MKRYAGVDVGKEQLDVAVHEGAQRRFKNTPADHEKIRKWLIARGVTSVVAEATGDHETPLLERLQAEGFEVARVNPKRIRDFAKARGSLAKTDRIDAVVIAHFGAALAPRPVPVLKIWQKRLRNSVRRREALVAQKTAESNRKSIKDIGRHETQSINRHIEWLETEIKLIEREAKELVKGVEEAKTLSKRLQTAKGVGFTVAATLMAELPELGTLNRKEIAALAGLAPYNNDSCTVLKRRMTWGGRAKARRTLYMAAISAMLSNPLIRQFAQRLQQKEKPTKVIIVACMRKLLTILNAMVANRTDWSSQNHQEIQLTT
jgi:transposase